MDTFDGTAWVGLVPFWMDQVRMRGLPSIPGASRFPELNLRTYVRERHTNQAGVYFFSLDAANPFAVVAARMFFRLPYYWARMKIESDENRGFHYSSDRLLSRHAAHFRARYRSLGKPCIKGGLETFFTERYALFTATSTICHGLWNWLRPNSKSMTCPKPTAFACPTRNPSCNTAAS